MLFSSLLFSSLLWMLFVVGLHDTGPRSATFEEDALPLGQRGGQSYRLMFVGCLTFKQHASVSQGRICTDSFTCCHTETEVADPTFHLTQSQYTDTGPISPSADPITPGAWQGSHRSANFEVTGMTRPRKNPVASGIRTRTFRSRGGRLTTRPTRRFKATDKYTNRKWILRRKRGWGWVIRVGEGEGGDKRGGDKRRNQTINARMPPCHFEVPDVTGWSLSGLLTSEGAVSSSHHVASIGCLQRTR